MSEKRQRRPSYTPTPVIDTLNGQAITGSDTVSWTFTVEGHVTASFGAGEYVICRLSNPPGVLNYRESDAGTGGVGGDNRWQCTFTQVVPPYDTVVGLTAYLYESDGTPVDSSTTLRITVHKPAVRGDRG